MVGGGCLYRYYQRFGQVLTLSFYFMSTLIMSLLYSYTAQILTLLKKVESCYFMWGWVTFDTQTVAVLTLSAVSITRHGGIACPVIRRSLPFCVPDASSEFGWVILFTRTWKLSQRNHICSSHVFLFHRCILWLSHLVFTCLFQDRFSSTPGL